MPKKKLKVETHSQDTQDSPLLNLPDEIKLHIMSFLGRKDLVRTGRVCKKLHDLSNDKCLNKFPDYEHIWDPEIIAEKVIAITQSPDRQYLGVLTFGSSENFLLIDAVSNIPILKTTINSHLDASQINLKLTSNNKYLIASYHTNNRFNYEGQLLNKGYSYIDVWDLENKKQIYTFENIPNDAVNDFPRLQVEVLSSERFLVNFINERCASVVFMGTHLPTSRYKLDYQNIYLYDINEKTAKTFYVNDTNIKHYADIKYYRACLSPNKKLYARISDLNLDIHDTYTGKKIKSISLSEMDIMDVISFANIQFGNDNKTIYMVSSEYQLLPNNKDYITKPFLIMINSKTDEIQKHFFKFDKYTLIPKIGNFTLLPGNHIALFENRWLDEAKKKILICDLLTQKLIKTINTTANSIFSSEDGSQMYILTDKGELHRIKVPLIQRELEQEPEQNAGYSMQLR